MQYHKYSLTELDEMLPFERDIYIKLLLEHLKKEQEEHGAT
jgi:hypothetical protein